MPETEIKKMKTSTGIHTFSLTLPRLGYQKVQEIVDSAYDNHYQVSSKSDQYNLDHVYKFDEFAEQGIRIEAFQYASHPGFVRLMLTPGSLLHGEYRPMDLFDASKEDWKKIQAAFNSQVNLDGFPISWDKFSLSRIDVTWDFYLDNDEEVIAWIHTIKKSMRSPKYRKIEFTKKTAKDPTEANRHSCEYCTATKRRDKKNGREYGKQPATAFKAYDKRFEVADENILDKPVLRLELSLSRQSLLSRLKKKKTSRIRKILKGAAKGAEDIIFRFLKSSMYIDGNIFLYEDALKMILNEPRLKDKRRAQMLELLRKCSDSDNLFSALKKMNLKRGQQDALLKSFKKINLSPITLPNSSKIQELPSIRDLIEY